MGDSSLQLSTRTTAATVMKVRFQSRSNATMGQEGVPLRDRGADGWDGGGEALSALSSLQWRRNRGAGGGGAEGTEDAQEETIPR